MNRITFRIDTPDIMNPNSCPLILPKDWKIKPSMTDIRKPGTVIECEYEPKLPKWLRWFKQGETIKCQE